MHVPPYTVPVQLHLTAWVQYPKLLRRNPRARTGRYGQALPFTTAEPWAAADVITMFELN
jgi:hypothetical protein